MDDLRERLDRRADSFEPPPDGLERLFARAARRTRRRRIGSGLLALVLLVGLGAILWALAPLGRGSPPAVPGVEAERRSTYELSDFQIEYPFDDPRASVGPDDSRAGVALVIRWRNGIYPGQVNCRLTLRDAGGTVVGTLSAGIDSATDGAQVRPSGFVVPVSARPVSAEGACEEGAAPTGILVMTAAEISRPTNRATGTDRTLLTLQVSQTDSGGSGIRDCSLRIFLTDGTVEESRFNTNVWQLGSRITLNVPGDPGTVRDARADCGPMEQ